MISAKDAIHISLAYMADIFSDVTGFDVEEIELSDNGDHWSITISMPDKSNSPINILATGARKYKKIIVDSRTGIVKAMQIRKL